MVRSKNASWYFSYRWNGNGSCENEQEQGNGAFWGLFIIALVAVFYLGLKLPIGWQVF